MSKRHVCLFVEDHLDTAESMIELLGSWGYDCAHSTNQEEATALLAQREFCFALLDLSVKVMPKSIKGYPDAGFAVLRAARKMYPVRCEDLEADTTHHLFPILVFSGEANERTDVERAMLSGADGFLVKPISKNEPPLEKRIKDLLRITGRAHHADCSAVNRRARVALEAAKAPVTGVVISVPGNEVKRRNEILVGEAPVGIKGKQFDLLIRLIDARDTEKNGWLHVIDAGAKNESSYKPPSDLRAELKAFLPPRFELLESDFRGSYRLHPSVTIGPVDWDRLSEHSSAVVQGIAKAQLKRRRKS